MLLSEDSSAFLSQISTMSAVGQLQDRVFDDFATELEALDIRSDATRKRVDQVAALEKQLKDEKTTIDDKLAEAESLLDRLKEEEREDILSRGSERLPSDVPASGRAAAAIQYAMAQVGDAYVYGAAGPSAFDCSGLTMMAWAQAGVALPHSSSAQYGSGPHVAASDLQPGDLVFYYSPISHVGMYIGNGMIVHAANPGTGVQVAGALLDAVRRRGPPWLNHHARRPVVHDGGWPAFRCVSWWPSVRSPGRWSTPTRTSPRVPRPSRTRSMPVRRQARCAPWSWPYGVATWRAQRSSLRRVTRPRPASCAPSSTTPRRSECATSGCGTSTRPARRPPTAPGRRPWTSPGGSRGFDEAASRSEVTVRFRGDGDRVGVVANRGRRPADADLDVRAGHRPAVT